MQLWKITILALCFQLCLFLGGFQTLLGWLENWVVFYLVSFSLVNKGLPFMEVCFQNFPLTDFVKTLTVGREWYDEIKNVKKSGVTDWSGRWGENDKMRLKT